MKNVVKEVVKELVVGKEEYTIIWNGKFGVYMAINKKDIDEDKKLTRAYNGISGCASKELSRTIEQVIFRDEYQSLLDNGMEASEAMITMMNKMNKTIEK